MLIPRRLLDQLPQEPFNTAEFLAAYTPHPANYLYVVMDKSDEIEPRKGFFWLQANTLEKTLRILLLSLDEEFRRENPTFFNSVLVPLFKKSAKALNFMLVWGRMRTIRDGQTHLGRLREYRVYCLTEESCPA